MAESSTASNAPKVATIQSLPQYQAQVAARTAQVQGQVDIINAISTQLVDQATAKDQFIPGTTETAESLLVKKNAELEAQRQVQRIANAADWENVATLLAQDISSLAMKKRDLTAKIETDASVSLFDDPITALANAFTLPWDQQALAATDQKLTAAASDMQKINAHIQQSAQTADKIQTTITDESIASISGAVANLFKGKELNARMEAAKSGMQGIEALLRLDAAQADALVKISQERDREEARAQRKKVFDLQVAEFDRKVKKDLSVEEQEEVSFKLANAALRNDGKAELTRDVFNLTKAKSGAFIDQLVLKGLKLNLEGPQGVSHGSTVEERFAWQTAINWQPKTPQQMSVMEMQREAREGAAAVAMGTGKEKAVATAAGTEKIFNANWDKKQANITEGSPFKAPAWEVIAKNSPAIASNPIWEKYIAPRLAADPNGAKQSIDEKAVVEAAAAAVANKEVTSAAAARFVKNIFDTSINANNRVHEFGKIANRYQTKYGVRLEFAPNAALAFLPGPTNRSGTFNLVDPVQVEAAIQASVVTKLIGAGMVSPMMGGAERNAMQRDQ